MKKLNCVRATESDIVSLLRCCSSIKKRSRLPDEAAATTRDPPLRAANVPVRTTDSDSVSLLRCRSSIKKRSSTTIRLRQGYGGTRLECATTRCPSLRTLTNHDVRVIFCKCRRRWFVEISIPGFTKFGTRIKKLS